MYSASGYSFPIRVFPEAEAAGLLAELRRSEALLGGPLKGRMNQKPHPLFPWMDALVRHPAVLDAVESVIGPDIFCWERARARPRASFPDQPLRRAVP